LAPQLAIASNNNRFLPGPFHKEIASNPYARRFGSENPQPRFFMKYLNSLLIFVPITLAAEFLHVDESLIFVMACLAIVPLAVLIGDATEQIALYAGPKIGGLLNATMGNVPEFFIGLFAVQAGLYKLVLASMAGSIIGNLMLVLGFSVLCGGVVNKTQTFDKNIARSNFSLLCFAAVSIVLPLAFKLTNGDNENIHDGLAVISFTMAAILLIIYILGLVFSLVTHRNLFLDHDSADNDEEPKWSLARATAILAVTTVFVAIESEILVSTVEKTVREFGLPEAFIGIIIIPIIGNVAEHASAVVMAVKNKVDISVEIAVGSSMQIAMFVSPVLILFSFAIGHPLIYVYDPFIVVAVLAGILLPLIVFQDGRTYWLEGALLIFSYLVFSVAFFFFQY
jgi:Ca2+:H+ antiporter